MKLYIHNNKLVVAVGDQYVKCVMRYGLTQQTPLPPLHMAPMTGDSHPVPW